MIDIGDMMGAQSGESPDRRGRNEMLTEERYREILQWVAQRGSATVAELTALLGSSESTVRRDLTCLLYTSRCV